MNGYFQIIFKEGIGTFLRCFPPTENGRPINIKEVMDYLDFAKLPFSIEVLNGTLNGLESEQDIFLCEKIPLPIREICMVSLSFDKMKAMIQIYPPSTGGRECTREDIESALRMKKVSYGIDDSVIDKVLNNRQYGFSYVVAQGTPPRQGTDAKIEYFFQTDQKAKPTLREDGTVDYYDLNLVSQCAEGELLAVLTPADLGEIGSNVVGEKLKPKDVVKLVLKHGPNVEMNEEKTELRSTVQGHVKLIDDKVIVSNILELDNVDTSTGNIEYDGAVVVKGNVSNNFSIKAQGNIDVKGVVEGAYLESGGNIVIARGINGMNKGKLVAEGNVISKFLENCTVTAGGYVETEAIIHSHVQAKTEINVVGKRATINGGTVCATNLISAKNLGTQMGTPTNVIVGVDPSVIERSYQVKKELEEAQKNLNKVIPILDTMKKKLLAGATAQAEEKKYMTHLIETARYLKQTVEARTLEMQQLKETIEDATNARVKVTGEMHPGVTITISETTMRVNREYAFCQIKKKDGAIRVDSL